MTTAAPFALQGRDDGSAFADVLRKAEGVASVGSAFADMARKAESAVRVFAARQAPTLLAETFGRSWEAAREVAARWAGAADARETPYGRTEASKFVDISHLRRRCRESRVPASTGDKATLRIAEGLLATDPRLPLCVAPFTAATSNVRADGSPPDDRVPDAPRDLTSMLLLAPCAPPSVSNGQALPRASHPVRPSRGDFDPAYVLRVRSFS